MVKSILTIQQCIEGKLHIFNFNETDAYCNAAGNHLVMIYPNIEAKKFLDENVNNPYLCQKCKESMQRRINDLINGIRI